MCHFRFLGAAALEENGKLIVGPSAQPRRIALLSILATEQPHIVSRDKVVGLLWPDSSQNSARHLLSESLYVVRQRLGGESVISTGENLRLNESLVRIDVREFSRAVEGGRLDEAVELYAGPFLDGAHLNVGQEFQRWMERQRRRLGTTYRRALETLATKAEKTGDWTDARRWWSWVADSDPYDSRVTLRYMQALALSGNRAEAIRHARYHQRLLEDDLGVEASREVMGLMESLRGKAARFVPLGGSTRTRSAPEGGAWSDREADTDPSWPLAARDRRSAPPFRDRRTVEEVAEVAGPELSPTSRASEMKKEEGEEAQWEVSGSSASEDWPPGWLRSYSRPAWFALAAVVFIYLAGSRAWQGVHDSWASGGPPQVLVLPFSVGGASELARFSDSLYFLLSHELDAIPGYQSADAGVLQSSTDGRERTRSWDLDEAWRTAASSGACCMIMGSLVQISPSIVGIHASLYDRRAGKEPVARTWIELERAELEHRLPDLPERLWTSLLPALEKELAEEGEIGPSR